MQISTKGRYGLRMVVDIAVYGGETVLSLGDIAARQAISPGYLEQLVIPLKNSNIISSRKGAGGGYKLSVPAHMIKVEDVLSSLEGKFEIVDFKNEMEKGCHIEGAVKDLVWDRVNESINRLYLSTTIEELAESYKAKMGLSPIMYYI